MDYPATQRFVDDDEGGVEKHDDGDESPLETEKCQIGSLVIDSVNHPLCKGINKVGRIDSCDIVVEHNTISKEHAEIEAGIGLKSTFVSDLGSLNKTRLNNAVLRPGRSYQLQHGDVLKFGSVQAVFLHEEVKKDTVFARPECPPQFDDVIIPESPGPTSGVAQPIIPGTPDLSFDRSSMGTSRCSDVSIIAGTQEKGSVGVTSTPRCCRAPALPELVTVSLNSEKTEETATLGEPRSSEQMNISELETQTDFPPDDSDEENIFDMMTQQSNIHDEETQKFFTTTSIAEDNVCTIKSSRSSRHSINNVEMQKLSVDEVNCIHDVETQIIDPPSTSVWDLETQRVGDPPNCAKDLDPRKYSALASGNDGSETDEEGIFEDNGGTIAIGDDVLTRPIRASRNEWPSGRGNRNETNVLFEDSKVKPPIREDDVKRREEEISATVSTSASPKQRVSSELKVYEKALVKDSIESKLNNMFDEVNDTSIDEPTQLLTQRLERMLECTQIENGEPKEDCSEEQCVTEPIEASVDTPNETTVTSRDTARAGVLHILSTQELFADLPAVDIFERANSPASNSKASDDLRMNEAVTPRPKTSKESKSDSLKGKVNEVGQGKVQSKVAQHASDVELVDPHLLEYKNAKVHKSKQHEERPVVKSFASTVTARRKPRMPKDVVASPSSMKSTPKESSPSIGKMTNSRKGTLSPKKRGKLTVPALDAEATAAPATMQAKVLAASPRAVTRSNEKIRQQTPKDVEKASTRSAGTNVLWANDGRNAMRGYGAEVPGAKLPSTTMVRLNYAKPETPRVRRSARPRRKKGKAQTPDPCTPVVKSLGVSSSPPNLTGDAGATERPTPAKMVTLATVVVTPAGTQELPKSAKRTSAPEVPAFAREKPENLSKTVADGGGVRTRRTRRIVETLKFQNAKNLCDYVKSDTGTQSSLESQEIQTILSSVARADPDEGKPLAGGSGCGEQSRKLRNRVVDGSPVTGRINTRVIEERDEIPKAKKRQRDENESTEAKKRTGSRTRDKEIANVSNRHDSPEVELMGGTQLGVTVAARSFKVKSRDGGVIAVAKSETADEEPARAKSNSRDHSPRNGTPAEASSICRTVTPSARTRRQISRKAASHAEKENVIEACKAKRGRKNVSVDLSNAETSPDDEVQVSSPLRRGRSSVGTQIATSRAALKTEYKILFTGLNDPRLVSIVQSLGGTVTEKPPSCTVLVTDKVRRTYKFLCAMAMAVPIVGVDWLKESERKGHFLVTTDFLLDDPAEEAKFKFSLRRSLAMARDDRLLNGFNVVLTPNTAPPPNVELKGMINACGGKVLLRPPVNWPKKSLIVSRQEDLEIAKKFLAKAPKWVRLVSVEFILTGILRHELNFEEHTLAPDVEQV